MQRILTAAQMRESDRVTIEERGVPGLVLMENAGGRLYELLVRCFSPLSEQYIVVLCGKGNNGGDGFVVARQIATRVGAERLEVVLLVNPAELKGDAAVNYRALRGVGVEPRVAPDAAAWREILPRLTPATLVIDALLGTGLRGPVKSLFAEVIADVNNGFPHAKVVAVDIPSGMPSDAGEPIGPAMRADHTVTFTAPKVSQVFPPNCEHMGDLAVAPIGTANAVLDALEGPLLALVEASDVGALFVPREKSAHKGSYGHVLVIGGSKPKPGAAMMAGTAALRAGAGLVTVATAASAAPAIVSDRPELMTLPIAELEDGSMGESAFRESWLEDKTVAAIGPGLGTSEENRRLVGRVVREANMPIVVDADGLTALAGIVDWRAASGLVVLTPHPGEMARLTGLSSAEVQGRRVEVARLLATQKKVYVVLKGFRTLIASPDGGVLVNPTGTPALAKGGSGDVLTGMVAGLLAQFPAQRPEVVIAAAVYLHGLAAELAVEESGEQTLAATDLLDYLPRAIRRVSS